MVKLRELEMELELTYMVMGSRENTVHDRVIVKFYETNALLGLNYL